MEGSCDSSHCLGELMLWSLVVELMLVVVAAVYCCHLSLRSLVLEVVDLLESWRREWNDGILSSSSFVSRLVRLRMALSSGSLGLAFLAGGAGTFNSPPLLSPLTWNPYSPSCYSFFTWSNGTERLKEMRVLVVEIMCVKDWHRW